MGKNTPVKSPFSLKLHHVGVVVRDIDKAVKRLESLGIGPFEAPPLPPVRATLYYRGKPSDSKVKILQARVGEINLELFQPVEGEDPWREFLDRKGEGIHHIAFAADDPFEEAAAFLEKGAYDLHSGRLPSGGGGIYLDLGVGDIIIELFKD
jgi:methylmalonyl-CoA/ethylmalonyl-CoA epimerase